MDETGDGSWRIGFEDGTHAEADIVLGCDGVNSSVRSLLLPDAPPARVHRGGRLGRPVGDRHRRTARRRPVPHGLRAARVLRVPGGFARRRVVVREPPGGP
ncbi:hypothetical protein GTV15_05100 [Streptomyces sp. SID7803]|nr:hypothetical protein [Streptomyces sp. SID7803]